MNLSKNFTLIYLLGISIGILFMIVYADNQILTGDQTQMIDKGYLGAYDGIWLQYGNAASSVGNVPGPLSAYVIGVPLLIWDTPYFPMALIIILHLLAFLMLDSIIKNIFDKDIRILFLLIYFVFWFLNQQLYLNIDPGYRILFPIY